MHEHLHHTAVRCRITYCAVSQAVKKVAQQKGDDDGGDDNDDNCDDDEEHIFHLKRGSDVY